MAHRILRDEKEEGWEESDFPIVCEVRMTGRQTQGPRAWSLALQFFL